MISDRLQKALDAGDVLALFPLLKDWPADELNALMEDARAYQAASSAAIDEGWEKLAVQPSIFFDKTISEELDRVRDEKKMEIMFTAAEICSVALFYLGGYGGVARTAGEKSDE